MTPELWVTLIGMMFGSGLLGSVVTFLFTRKQKVAETARTSAETKKFEVEKLQAAVNMALDLANGLAAQVTALEEDLCVARARMGELEAQVVHERESQNALRKRFDALEKRHQRLLGGVRVLIEQVYDLGGKPEFLPDDDEVK